MIDLEILDNGPEDWTHVSTSMIDTPPTWLRYEVAGVYSVWMDDNGTNPNPFWREMPNNCIEFPEFIRSRNDIEQLAKANERVKELKLILVAITHADETGYVDDVGFVENWNQVCDETKALLNKFATEKKIEVLQKVSYETSYDVVSDACNWEIEQLHKEQE